MVGKFRAVIDAARSAAGRRAAISALAATCAVSACNTGDVFNLQPAVDVGTQTAAVPQYTGMQRLAPSNPYMTAAYPRMDMPASPSAPAHDNPADAEGHERVKGPAVTPLNPQTRSGFYVNVRSKFVIACSFALAWTALSVWLSLRWVHELALATDLAFALIAIAFIAYVPGFMNAFLLSTLVMDRKPPRRALPAYPGATILVAAYNEAAAIHDTLTSLSRQDYTGEFEVLVLNDGSTDDTVALAEKAIAELQFPAKGSARVLDFKQNRGKSAVLNDGLAEAKHDLVLTIDGDSWVKRDGLRKIVERLLSDPPDTQAVAGAVRCAIRATTSLPARRSGTTSTASRP